MGVRETILDGTIEVFNESGLKFTMDDVAKRLKMSKKTIYKAFPDKKTLFYSMVDYLFDGIREKKAQIFSDPEIDTAEKIRRILGAMPESYKNIDFRKLYLLKDKYPEVYHRVEEKLETGWEEPLLLINQGVKEGCVRPVNLSILKMMMEASLEQFFQRDILISSEMSYVDALNEVVSILTEGIMIPGHQKEEK